MLHQIDANESVDFKPMLYALTLLSHGRRREKWGIFPFPSKVEYREIKNV